MSEKYTTPSGKETITASQYAAHYMINAITRNQGLRELNLLQGKSDGFIKEVCQRLIF